MLEEKKIRLLIACLLGLGVLFAAARQMNAEEALSVGLVSFEAVPTSNGVRLTWAVETEIGTAGYTIRRGENGSFEHLADPGGSDRLFILAKGGPAQAAAYEFLDESAVRESTYTYELYEITTGSSEDLQADVTLTFLIEPTSTPITFSGGIGNPGSSAQGPTATPAATLQATATAGVPPTSTSAPPPTRSAPTPLPTATAVPQQAEAETTTNSAAGQAAAGSSPPAPSAESADAPQSAVEETIPDEPALEADVMQTTAVEAAGGAVASALELDTAQAAERTAAEGAGTGAANASPRVIGGSVDKTSEEERPTNNTQASQTGEDPPAYSDSSRILLWVAFIMALVVFAASVVGAILLYNRQRSSN